MSETNPYREEFLEAAQQIFDADKSLKDPQDARNAVKLRSPQLWLAAYATDRQSRFAAAVNAEMDNGADYAGAYKLAAQKLPEDAQRLAVAIG